MATIELNRRRVLTAILIIGLATAGAGAGTFAFFSDTESSTNNVINAGTLTLSGASDAQFGLSDTVPDTWHNGSVNTTYSGSVDAEVDMNVTLAEPTEDSEPGVSTELTASEFAAYVRVDKATVNVGGTTQDLTTVVSSSAGTANGRLDLADFEAHGKFDNVTGTLATDGDPVEVDFELYFVSSAGNDAQADGVNVTVDFVAEQSSAD